MSYAVGYTLGAKEIFENFDKKKLDLTSKQCEEAIGNRHKEIIVERVFKRCLALILDDIIENSEIFNLPTGKRKSYFKMHTFSKDQFIQARRNGKWEDVDYYSSFYSANQIVFEYQVKEIMYRKLVYLNTKYRDRITELTNQGKNYY